MMRGVNFVFFLAALTVGPLLYGQGDVAEAYIKRYQDIAVKEMHRTGVPASITMAQGILESDYGRSKLAVKANNHFGIKCGGDWKGPTQKRKGACYRKYKSAEASYKDHSDFLANRPNYASLFKLKRTDYKKWAKGLKKAGYSTSGSYPKKLISLIERYNLDRLDRK